ncbi:MAG: histidinol-phosphate aminotransferase family protein [Turicibacter sp.]|nr:histidinol-phosphate aminotransferase family protein [Turicibacter sp.]
MPSLFRLGKDYIMRKDLMNMPVFNPQPQDIINLTMNENPFADHSGLIQEKLAGIAANSMFSAYGSGSHDLLVQRYADYAGIDKDMVLPGPGSDNLIPVLFNALTEKTILTFDVDFFRYWDATLILKRNHVTAPIKEGVSALIQKAKETKAELVILSNPNNPLGIVQEDSEILKMLQELDCYIVIDEAYMEYYGKSLVRQLKKYPKLIILRTMSKAWGIAGLRVGFILAQAPLIKAINAVQGYHFLNTLSAGIGAEVLTMEKEMKQWVGETNAIRDDFMGFLEALGLDALKSQSNFIFVNTPHAEAIAKSAVEQGIAIILRGSDAIRITVGTKEQMELLKAAIKKVLKPQLKKGA